MATRGRVPQASPEKPGPPWGHLCKPLRERHVGRGPRGPCPEGSRRQCGWALDLRVFVKRFLISAMVAWGSTWGKQRPGTGKLWAGSPGPRIPLGEAGWTGVLGNCYGRGEGWGPGPQTM